MNMGKSVIDFNEKKGFICDMDGVIYHGNQILPGVPEFIQWLHDEKKEYLFLTNNSGFGFPQKYACVPVAISIGAINARQAGAMPFSIGPETSEFAPISFAPFRTKFVAFVNVSNE